MQRAASLDDVVNQVELNVDDIDRAPEIARDVGPMRHFRIVVAERTG